MADNDCRAGAQADPCIAQVQIGLDGFSRGTILSIHESESIKIEVMLIACDAPILSIYIYIIFSAM